MAGDFLLSSSGDYNDNASSCTPGDCGGGVYPGSTLDAHFSASVGISGPNSFLQSIGNSGFDLYGDCGSGDCFADVSLSDSKSDMVYLPTGSYTFEVTYYGYNDSIGANFGGGGTYAGLDPSPVPTPEPALFFPLVIAGLAILTLARLSKLIASQ